MRLRSSVWPFFSHSKRKPRVRVVTLRLITSYHGNDLLRHEVKWKVIKAFFLQGLCFWA